MNGGLKGFLSFALLASPVAPLAIGEGRGAELADETNPCFINRGNVCGAYNRDSRGTRA